MDEAMLDAMKRGLRIEKDGTVIGIRGLPIACSLMCRSKKDRSNARRYLTYGYRAGIHKSQIYIHRLQAYTKFGNALFEDGVKTRHGEGGHLDNSWDNINIGTHAANMQDIPVKKRRSAQSKRKKLSDDQVREVLKLYDSDQGWSYGKLGKKYGVSRFTIRSYVKRTSRSYVEDE